MNLRVGADLNEDEEEIDRIMKQLKKGRWALGMTGFWKMLVIMILEM